MEKFLNGDFLYGDNFNEKEIEKWYLDEMEASESLRKTYKYYRKINTNSNYANFFYGFKFLKGRFNNVLSVGGAYGDELLPIIKRIKGSIFIVESSKKLIDNQKGNKKFKYLLANISGKMDLENESINLVTCFSTLHHIPNVSFVLSEVYRVLKPGGVAIISEPIVSMGDWLKPETRKGLTLRERGIPIKIFDNILKDQGFLILRRNFFCFSPIHLLFSRILKKQPYNNKIIVFIDCILSKMFSFNNKYYRKNIFNKLSPSCIFYVLKKSLK